MEYWAHRSEDGSRIQTLEEHLQGTARLSGNFAETFGCKEWGIFCGLLHDFGKYSQEFQKRIRGEDLRVDHSTAGAQEAFKRNNVAAAYCIAGHHSGLCDGGSMSDTENSATLHGRLKKKVPGCHEENLSAALPLMKAPSMQPLTKGVYSLTFLIRMLYSCLVDADFLDTEAFMKEQMRSTCFAKFGELLARLLKYIEPWMNLTTNTSELNQRRTRILTECLKRGEGEQGIYCLTVPTGGGKTVSSLAFALKHAQEHGLNRIIYVIPYSSIIEQNAEVFRKIIGEDVVLEHHWNVEYSNQGEEMELRQLATENWDIPLVVTTNVQFFESLYANRSSKCRKLHNIANSVLIFDEAQMLPKDFLQPCIDGIAELVLNYGCTAVLCTATQPALQKMFPTTTERQWRGEICPDISEQFHAFRRITWTREGKITKDTLAAMLGGETSALCILNTRSQVLDVFHMIEDVEGAFMLSTCLYPEHRREILNRIRTRLREGKPCIVVSTSLVEAGVDLDFDTVYRELAGLDSMIQAAGRCNREGKKAIEQSLVHIFEFTKEDQKSNPLIAQEISVAKIISAKYDDIGSPEAIHDYFTRLYYAKGDSLDKYHVITDLDQCEVLSLPFASVAKKFHIIGDETKSILITDTDEAKDLEQKLRLGIRTKGLLRKIAQYSVNVYQNTFNDLLGAGALNLIDEEIAVLRDLEQYSQTSGLNIKYGKGECIFL